MGKERSTTTATQTQSYQPAPYESELNKLQYEQALEFDPIQRQLNSNAGNIVNKLLLGQPLPGYLQGLPGGIDEATTQSISQKAIQDLQPTFQSSGLIDSGVNASISARTAGDIRRQTAEFNIGNLLNLLNLGVGGQAQVQQPSISNTSILSQRLAGLRTGTATATQTTMGTNPFLKSFSQQAGTGTAKFLFGG